MFSSHRSVALIPTHHAFGANFSAKCHAQTVPFCPYSNKHARLWVVGIIVHEHTNQWRPIYGWFHKGTQYQTMSSFCQFLAAENRIPEVDPTNLPADHPLASQKYGGCGLNVCKSSLPSVHSENMASKPRRGRQNPSSDPES